MIRMRYGSALGIFGEQRHSPNATKCIGVWLGAFGEQRRSPNAHNRTPMHLGAFGERLCSPNIPNVRPYCIQTINMVCMRYGSAFVYIWRANMLSKCTQMHCNVVGYMLRAYMLSKCTQYATIGHTDHKYGPNVQW